MNRSAKKAIKKISKKRDYNSDDSWIRQYFGKRQHQNESNNESNRPVEVVTCDKKKVSKIKQLLRDTDSVSSGSKESIISELSDISLKDRNIDKLVIIKRNNTPKSKKTKKTNNHQIRSNIVRDILCNLDSSSILSNNNIDRDRTKF